MRPELKTFLINTGYLVPVWNFPEYYITKYSQVYSEKMHKWLTPYHRDGYNRVRMRKDDKCFDVGVHRLVGRAFVNGYFDGAVINHINGIKDDNRPKNLEWTTQKRNAQLAINKPVIVTTKSGLELYYENCTKLCNDLWSNRSGNLAITIKRRGGIFKYGIKIRYASEYDIKKYKNELLIY